MEIELNAIPNGSNIIDIREKHFYAIDHIPNSINIPYNQLINGHKAVLDPTKSYYIYCGMGHKSKALCEILNKLGYKCYSIIGGYNKYHKRTI